MMTAAIRDPVGVNGPARLIAAMLTQLNRQFELQPPRALLHWALETFGPHVALGTGFGPTGIVLMHMVTQIRPETTIFYLDTGLLFSETYDLRDRLEAQLGIRLTRLYFNDPPAEQAPGLWQHDPNACCHLRKVVPLRRFLADKDAWITGLRRDQSPGRAQTQLLEWSIANQVVKLNPLANWREDQVWAYIQAHELPYNPLHDEGYPSLGCWPCTRPVQPGETNRAGRWAGMEKTESGIHFEGGRMQRRQREDARPRTGDGSLRVRGG